MKGHHAPQRSSCRSPLTSCIQAKKAGTWKEGKTGTRARHDATFRSPSANVVKRFPMVTAPRPPARHLPSAPRFPPCPPPLGTLPRYLCRLPPPPPEVVEHVRAVPPHIHAAVLPEALVVEAIHLRMCVCTRHCRRGFKRRGRLAVTTSCVHQSHSDVSISQHAAGLHAKWPCRPCARAPCAHPPARLPTHLCDLPALVVAAYERDAVWVSDLCACAAGSSGQAGSRKLRCASDAITISPCVLGSNTWLPCPHACTPAHHPSAPVAARAAAGRPLLVLRWLDRVVSRRPCRRI